MKKYHVRWTSIKKKYNQENQDEYNTIDVLLLSDVAKNSRKYKIDFNTDSLGFYKIPLLSWASKLRKTEIEFELLKDIKMLHVYENAIRGGVTRAAHQFPEPKTKCMFNYGERKEKWYLACLVLNKQYW